MRRVLYRYFFREFSLASIQLVAGAALFGFGLAFGLYHWWSAPPDQLVPTGTIMIAALTFLIGFQLLLSFLNYDISSSPREPLHPFLARAPRSRHRRSCQAGHGGSRATTSRTGARRHNAQLVGETQPRPTNGILLAITVMNSTLASSGRLAM